MSSRPRSLLRTPRRKRSLRRQSRSRLCGARKCLRNVVNGGRVQMGISEKLETLKNLIPARQGEMKADRLFKETAEYIVFLRAQVQILQRLIDFYGTDEKQKVV
ncbi:PREDICTED: transcription factor UPBEAT1 [Nelumbo nucifera]|uniref:Transcription factor UPBEAT1 n=1 Tax=Nelumbo nucifera TaxID=4432 RepID=A0A1U8A3R3_NELNU|nr:PREDICTED: transcription factor UPBEAT1 [Nelumbo nucifera]